MKKIWLFMLLISCTAANDPIPGWYLNPPQNNTSYLYGVGYGTSLDQATKIALNNIAEKISVTVSSSFATSKQESAVNDQALYEAEYEQDINSTVQEINFTNYQTEKSEQVGEYIYSLVKVARSEVINNYMKQIENIDKDISLVLKDMEKQSIIEQFARLYRVSDKIRVNEVNLKIVETIEKSDMKVKDYYDKYDNLLKLEAQIKNNIVIKIIAKLSDEKVIEVISKAINDLNIKSGKILDPKNKGHALLRVVTDTKHEKIYGVYLAKIKVEMKLLENFGNQISSGFIEVSGSSAISSVGAVDAAIADLRNKIQQQGLLNIIGL